MTREGNLLIFLGSIVALGGCQSMPDNPAVPTGIAAYDNIPVQAGNDDQQTGVLVAGDALAIKVLREPDLSFDRVVVDESGSIQMPLIGSVTVAGLTPAGVAQELTNRLGARYLRGPQISVNVVERVGRTVTVEGEVERPGIFAIAPDTTLLGALALAQSPTQLAKRDSIFVFRQVDGRRLGARFDLGQLRSGLVPDPQILPGDTIVVGFSASKSAFQDFLRATPLLNIFTFF